MNNTHKVVLKILFLIIVPTFVFVVWSKPARVKVNTVRLPPPPELVAPLTVTASEIPHISAADLVKSDLWTVDDTGAVMRLSIDGPQSLNRLNGFGTGTTISFIDSLNGWAFQSRQPFSALWRTSDGGKDWKRVSAGTGDESVVLPKVLKFFDEKQGWLADDYRLWRTADGGTSWRLATSLPGINDLAFIDARTLIVAKSDGEVMMSPDAGKNWRVGNVRGLYRLTTNRQLAWAVGLDNTVFQSFDSGRTWVELSRIYSQAVVLSLQFINKSEGWAAGNLPSGKQKRGEPIDLHGAGVLFHTEDGGSTWETLSVPTDLNFTRVAFLDSRSGWLIGHNGVYQTRNRGETWESVLLRTTQTVAQAAQ